MESTAPVSHKERDTPTAKAAPRLRKTRTTGKVNLKPEIKVKAPVSDKKHATPTAKAASTLRKARKVSKVDL